ncbi:MAG: trypsin-like peptidase domain-containing protein, partial [Myxococcota bacterium]
MLAAVLAAPFAAFAGPASTSAALQGPIKVGSDLVTYRASPRVAETQIRGSGTLVWKEELQVDGASYIAPHFGRFALPEGAWVVVRSADGQRTWNYTGFGKGHQFLSDGFWGIHIPGSTAIVELYSAVPVAEGAVIIDRFAHGFPDAFRTLSPSNGIGTEAICGGDDSRWARCYQSSEPAVYSESRAVARLMINGTNACTGWLVGSQGHLMTNNHCIDSSSDALNTDYEFMAEGASCSTNCASWGACPGTIAATSGTLIQTDAPLDYTLIKLPATIASTYGYMQMRSSGAVTGERIYIPQHPRAWGKRIAIESTHPQNPGECIVDTLNEPACTGASVPDVGYFCDTQGGSSGSPVLGYGDHCVVALHHCANCENRGVPIDAVISDLGSNLPANALCGSAAPYRFGTAVDAQANSTSWYSVSMSSGLSNPRVVMGPLSFNGSQPANLRVRNVSGNGFQYQLDEWDYLDGGHVAESTGWLAMAAGNQTLGSLRAQAGSVSVNHNWTTVNFSQSFTSAPVVIAQTASYNGSQSATTRIRNVTSTSFQVRMQEEQANDGSHANETVHFIAIQTGTTNANGNTIRVGRT